jgi:RHS repeat-associated protein
MSFVPSRLDLEPTATKVRSCLFGPGIDEPLAMYRNGTVYYYDVDGVGSVSLVNDAAATIQDGYVYDACGQLGNHTSAVANPFGYTGREFGEVNDWFYRARYYSPGIGRFASEDGIHRASRPHLYRYVLNDPLFFIDPTGLDNEPFIEVLSIHPVSDIVGACGQVTGGGCTRHSRAQLNCNCECIGNGEWAPHPTVKVTGDIYIYDGPFALLPHPPDVNNAAQALAHEFAKHIRPAEESVVPIIETFSSMVFNSFEHCDAMCGIVAKEVAETYDRTLTMTQYDEAGGPPRP